MTTNSGFVPNEKKTLYPQTPWYEESQKLDIPGRGTTKSVEKLLQEIRNVMYKLQAVVIGITPGKYENGTRDGFLIEFYYEGMRGKLKCAALPVKDHHYKRRPKKLDRAQAQALYLIRDWLQAELHASVYQPGYIPLVQYLLGPSGKTTMETFAIEGNLPMLTAPITEDTQP